VHNEGMIRHDTPPAGGPVPTYSGPPIEACATDQALPRAVDVVVIGGGIAGISTALSLAERGVSVALCEKGALAAEQSSRNWGWVRKMGRDPRELPLMIESMRIWDELQGQHGISASRARASSISAAANASWRGAPRGSSMPGYSSSIRG
jgi:glycine/D-amino acid oxidase-like deaminating enzyme